MTTPVSALQWSVANSLILGLDKAVAVAGTPVPLSASVLMAHEICVQALSGNTGSVFVGGPDLTTSYTGMELDPGESFPITFADLNKVYIDAAVNGEGVSVVYRIV